MKKIFILHSIILILFLLAILPDVKALTSEEMLADCKNNGGRFVSEGCKTGVDTCIGRGCFKAYTTSGGGSASPYMITTCYNDYFSCNHFDGVVGACCSCNSNLWAPDPSAICSGAAFTQRNDCSLTSTRQATGTKTCPTGQVCSNGNCITPAICTGTIPANSQICTGDDTGLTANTVISLVSSCTTKKCEYTCKSGYILSSGQCVVPCTNDCSPSGSKICDTTTSYKTCGNYDADSCLEWSTATACSSGQTCSGGNCITPTYVCTGTIPANSQICTGDDTGLTANTVISLVSSCTTKKCEYTCKSGYILSGGKCVTCIDECTPGTKTCTTATLYKTCGQNDADICYEWSTETSCKSNLICSNGNCITPAPACTKTLGQETKETSCTDTIDNDCDTKIDLADTDCQVGELYCNPNGVLSSLEECDPVGPIFKTGQNSCTALGYAGGTLSCTSQCTVDKLQCTTTTPAQPVAPTLPCTDTDGLNLGTKGNIQGIADNLSFTNTDECISKNVVKEYYCTKTRMPKSRIYSCPAKYRCDDGACKL